MRERKREEGSERERVASIMGVAADIAFNKTKAIDMDYYYRIYSSYSQVYWLNR